MFTEHDCQRSSTFVSLRSCSLRYASEHRTRYCFEFDDVPGLFWTDKNPSVRFLGLVYVELSPHDIRFQRNVYLIDVHASTVDHFTIDRDPLFYCFRERGKACTFELSTRLRHCSHDKRMMIDHIRLFRFGLIEASVANHLEPDEAKFNCENELFLNCVTVLFSAYEISIESRVAESKERVTGKPRNREKDVNAFTTTQLLRHDFPSKRKKKMGKMRQPWWGGKRERFESPRCRRGIGKCHGAFYEVDCRLLLKLFHRLGPEQGEAVSSTFVPG